MQEFVPICADADVVGTAGLQAALRTTMSARRHELSGNTLTVPVPPSTRTR